MGRCGLLAVGFRTVACRAGQVDDLPSQDDARSSRPMGRDELARDWAIRVSRTAYIPLSAAKLTEELRELLNVVAEAVAQEPAVASQVGTRLVEIHCVGAESLRQSVEVLARFVAQEGADALKAALVIGATRA